MSRAHALRRLAQGAIALGAVLLADRAGADPTGVAEEANGLFGEGNNGTVDSATGALSYGYPFKLAPGRGVQPSLALQYSSSGQEREAGYAWGLNLPTIELKPLSGFPKFTDASNVPTAEAERYTFNGAPLVLVCAQADAACGGGSHPAWAGGQWRYFRHQVEGSFARIYQSSDRLTFRVQLPGGKVLELGTPKTDGGWPSAGVLPALETERDNPARIIRWRLVVERDGRHPKNAAVYSWSSLGGRGLLYLTDIRDTPPPAEPSPAFGAFANHTRLEWEPSGLAGWRYTFVDRAVPDFRLRRVAVASKRWDGEGAREVVRSYKLHYLEHRSTVPYTPGLHAPLWNHSFLRMIELSGHCGVEDGSETPPSNITCSAIPPTTFEYSTGTLTGFVTSTPLLEGSGPGTVNGNNVFNRPQHATVLDIDRDGLPDIVQGWPTTCAVNGDEGRVDVVGAPGAAALFCHHDSQFTFLQQARPTRAYFNRGHAAIQQKLRFGCIDADAIVTLNNPGRASLLSAGGPNVFGRWGEAGFLWHALDSLGKARTEFFPIVTRKLGEETTQLCGSGNPTDEWRFEVAHAGDWSTRIPRRIRDDDPTKPGWYVDVDGDGLADLLQRSTEPVPHLGQLQSAKVLVCPARAPFSRAHAA